MKTLSIALVFLTSAFLLVNCSSTLSVTTDYDKAVDFSQYKTFAINKTLVVVLNLVNIEEYIILCILRT